MPAPSRRLPSVPARAARYTTRAGSLSTGARRKVYRVRISYRTTALVSAFVVGALVVGFALNHKSEPVTCTGCGMPTPVLVAKTSIPRGTGGTAIAAKPLISVKELPSGQIAKDALMSPSEFHGEVAARAIPAGTLLTAADFALRGPIYYPSGYPKSVSSSQTPAKMVDYLGGRSFPSDLAVAPGVWVDGSPAQADIDTHVANGTLVGYCSSVLAFQAHNPQIPFATKCWSRH